MTQWQRDNLTRKLLSLAGSDGVGELAGMAETGEELEAGADEHGPEDRLLSR